MYPVFNNVLVYQDAYRDSVEALEWASCLTSQDACVRVLDVQPPLSALWHDLVDDKVEESPVVHRGKSLAQLAQRVEFPAGQITTEVHTGTPVVKIVQQAIVGGHDLLIKEAFSKASDFIFGSLDLRLMRYCPTPVWLAQPGSVRKCQRILVAINPEAEGEEIKLNANLLHQASTLAKGLDCQLFVVGAYRIPVNVHGRLDAGSILRFERHHQAVARRASENVDRMIQLSLKPVSRENVIVENGWPDEVILNAVERFDPDLLVMGSVARPGLTGLLIGNAAERVMRRVKCSVLTIKPAGFVSPIVPDDDRGGLAVSQFAY